VVTRNTKGLCGYDDVVRALDELPVALRTMRRVRGLSLREAAAEMDTAFVNVDRFERGRGYTSSTLRSILAWLVQQSRTEGGEADLTTAQP
jgi:transcriptional regulator with XRE-family HTH domain